MTTNVRPDRNNLNMMLTPLNGSVAEALLRRLGLVTA